MAEKKPVKKQFKRSQVEFVEKAIKDKPPETFPREPESNVCSHSNRDFVKGKAGFNCRDCGFFIPISSMKKIEVNEEAVHVAKVEDPDKVKMPKIDDKYNVIELPRAVFDVRGESFLKPESAVGEEDKRRLGVFSNKLKAGYKIKSLQQTAGNSYLFLLEK